MKKSKPKFSFLSTNENSDTGGTQKFETKNAKTPVVFQTNASMFGINDVSLLQSHFMAIQASMTKDLNSTKLTLNNSYYPNIDKIPKSSKNIANFSSVSIAIMMICQLQFTKSPKKATKVPKKYSKLKLSGSEGVIHSHKSNKPRSLYKTGSGGTSSRINYDSFVEYLNDDVSEPKKPARSKSRQKAHKSKHNESITKVNLANSQATLKNLSLRVDDSYENLKHIPSDQVLKMTNKLQSSIDLIKGYKGYRTPLSEIQNDYGYTQRSG